MKKEKRRLLLIPAGLLILLACAFFVYTETYSRADAEALATLGSDGAVDVARMDYGWYFDGPGRDDVLIFYPGGKVEETAYAPFLRTLAEKGLDVCLVRMPFRLAVFGAGRADDVPDYGHARRFVGGHSLGGAMAAVYAAGHEEVAGTVLCAAYPTKPLGADDLEVLVYGSEDGVLNFGKLESTRNCSAGRLEEYCIPGGNHAQFGSYGAQKGDGEARISAEEQRTLAADFILKAVRGE